MAEILIGIDVGGTFTHAVAVENPGNKIIAHAVTPTTHSSLFSVSEGIVKVFADVLEKAGVNKDDVRLVAHSTTQATNALLEGDVCKVAIVGMGSGIESLKAKTDTKVGRIDLGNGKYIDSEHCYFNTKKGLNADEVIGKIQCMVDQTCSVVVASEAFSVDNAENENTVCEIASSIGLPAVGGHEISQLYGLAVRTRTAVVNASILPKMTKTAQLTERSIKDSGINAPLLIMRSDGGVMNLAEMMKRPILTLLSGPAAGIAAALRYVKISDGIFLEVGGTSTDISAIKDGRAMTRSASIGGHSTYLYTLDSRTVGIGGGSMVRVKNGEIYSTGPRSAHIAGLEYITFTDPAKLYDFHFDLVSPLEGDPDDYLVLVNGDGKRYAITLSDAAVAAGYAREGDYSYGNSESVNLIFEELGKYMKKKPEDIAHSILIGAADKISPVVDALLEEYNLEKAYVSLVGGGGGATAVVPFLAQNMQMKSHIAPMAEVISAIGAALAMMREVVEKNCVDPHDSDIMKIRKEAAMKLESMGASPDSIDIQIEFDAKRNILRAIAQGSVRMEKTDDKNKVSDDEIMLKASEAFGISPDQVSELYSTSSLHLIGATVEIPSRMKFLRKKRYDIKVLDGYGVVKLQLTDASAAAFTAENYKEALSYVERCAKYSDAGILLPRVFLIYSSRICDYSSILDLKQLESLVKLETEGLEPEEKIIIAVERRNV